MNQQPNRAAKPSAPDFKVLPDGALIDIRSMCLLYGASPATIWRGVRSGAIAEPIRLGKKFTRWKWGAVRASLDAVKAA